MVALGSGLSSLGGSIVWRRLEGLPDLPYQLSTELSIAWHSATTFVAVVCIALFSILRLELKEWALATWLFRLLLLAIVFWSNGHPFWVSDWPAVTAMAFVLTLTVATVAIIELAVRIASIVAARILREDLT